MSTKDRPDEWVLRDLHEYEKKPFKSAEKGDLDLGKKADDQNKDEYHALFDYIKTHLEAHVKEVKPSTHLRDSVACLSGDVNDMSSYKDYSDLLFDMAVIAGGGKIDNPSRFSKMIGDLMANNLDRASGRG